MGARELRSVGDQGQLPRGRGIAEDPWGTAGPRNHMWERRVESTPFQLGSGAGETVQSLAGNNCSIST